VPRLIKGKLIVEVFPGGSAEFVTREDDGISYHASYHLTEFVTKFVDGRFTIAIKSDGDRRFIESNRLIVFRFHNIASGSMAALENLEQIKYEFQNNLLSLTVVVKNYPAFIVFENETQLIVDSLNCTNENLQKLLQASCLNTWMKSVLFDQIIHTKKEDLAEVIFNLADVPPEIKFVLYGELCDFGFFQFTQSMGEQQLVVWNTNQNPLFEFFLRKETAVRLVPQSLRFGSKMGQTVKWTFNRGNLKRKEVWEFTIAGFHAFSVVLSA
jgi:hypothetical protein